jgi:hypothetical protein
MATIVQGKDLLETVIAAFVAGVGITVVFSLAIWGGARFVDLNQEGRQVAAVAAAALGAFALAVTLAAVAFGIVVMTSK